MKVYLIAGEASGDRLGAALIAGLRQLVPGLDIAGVGGPEMQAAGLTSLFPMDDLSVMGLVEVLPKYRQLRARLHQTADHVLAVAPDVLITIDSPDFCLRVARRVRARRPLRAVHYVAPSVWAWRAGRAETMARSVDQVLALLPFEPPYLQAVGLRCDFVGHPVTTEPQATMAEASAWRAAAGIGDAPMILALPGSRRSEVSRLAPIFGAALRPVLARHPETRIVVPAAAPVAGLVAEMVRDWPGQPLMLDPRDRPLARTLAEKRAAFRAADAALAASGTVSLELAAAETPMVIAYDMNWLTRQIVQRMLKVDTVTLVNLVTGRRDVPEFLGKNCQPDRIAASLNALMKAPHQQTAALSEAMATLGAGGPPPGLRAAQAVLDGLTGPPGQATP